MNLQEDVIKAAMLVVSAITSFATTFSIGMITYGSKEAFANNLIFNDFAEITFMSGFIVLFSMLFAALFVSFERVKELYGVKDGK